MTLKTQKLIRWSKKGEADVLEAIEKLGTGESFAAFVRSAAQSRASKILDR